MSASEGGDQSVEAASNQVIRRWLDGVTQSPSEEESEALFAPTEERVARSVRAETDAVRETMFARLGALDLEEGLTTSLSTHNPDPPVSAPVDPAPRCVRVTQVGTYRNATGFPMHLVEGGRAEITEPQAPTNTTLSEILAGQHLHSFTRQVFPADGRFSLAVSLGRLQLSKHTSIYYPPLESGQLQPPFGYGENNSVMGWMTFLDQPPGNPTLGVATVKARLRIGEGSSPYHFMHPIPQRGGGISAHGSARLRVRTAEGATAEEKEPFLAHHVAGTLNWLEVPPKRVVELFAQVPVGQSDWLIAELTCSLSGTRWWFADPAMPPSRDLKGFVGIDLRDSGEQIPAMSPVLMPSGPIRLEMLTVEYCPWQVE